jgi:hypothetical protein
VAGTEILLTSEFYDCAVKQSENAEVNLSSYILFLSSLSKLTLKAKSVIALSFGLISSEGLLRFL